MNRKARRAASKTGSGGLPPVTGFGADPTAYFHEGNRLAQQGQLEQAIDQYRRAIAAKPDYAHALANLGNALMMVGQPDEAIGAWRRAVAADPSYALAYSNLGLALSQQGRIDEAIAHLRRAVELKPGFVDALDNLARALLAAGRASQALQTARRAVAAKATTQTKRTFVDCLRHVSFPSDDPDLRATLVLALLEPWARPDRLIGPAAALASKNPPIAECVDRVAKAWPARLSDEELWSPAQRSAIGSDPLLRALLDAAPICDLGLERFLTNARSVLLAQARAATPPHTIDETALAFWCALAHQCFINEYVFAVGEDERDEADQLLVSLIARLRSGADIPPIWLAAVSAFHPLHSLPPDASLMARPWPPAVRSLLMQQVLEPLEEAQHRASIPALTAIENDVSLAVKEQYEENPYPRWVTLPASIPFDTFENYLCGILPWTDIAVDRRGEPCQILVAGCGTGLHAIDVAQRSKDARVLAIDLSLTSLAYAQRKTRALGLANLDYAQADILKAGSIARRFDVIESGGVLHHLDDPWAGWRALLTLLRPGGYMFVGLYSEAARQAVVAARRFIATQGYRPSADDIRRFRQDVATAKLPLGNLLTSPDFFSTSGCRDLFFNVQEHRLSLPQIKSFLHDNGLKFLGFNLDPQALQQFRRRHPEVGALTDLDLWHAFESDHPRTFAAMYQFWIQKPL